MSKVATVVQLVITDLNEVLPEKDSIMVITKMLLDKIKCLLEFIGRSKSKHLKKMFLSLVRFLL
jgi:hypothetical protein